MKEVLENINVNQGPIMGVISNGLTLLDVGYYWQLVVKGGVIIAAVLLDCLRNQSEQA